MYAANFGIEREIDIYFVASIIPLILSTSIYYIAQNHLIPLFSKSKAATGELPAALLKKGIYAAILFSTAVSLLLFLFRRPILYYFFDANDTYAFALGEAIFTIYIATIPLYTVISVLTAWKYFTYDYLRPLISQLWSNISIIIFVMLFSAQLGSKSIAFGYLTGVILQLVHMVWVCKDELFTMNSNTQFSFKAIGFSGGLMVIFLIEFVGQLMPFVDRSFYSALPSGTIAAYNYALTIMLLPISIAAVGFSTALFPQISELYAAGNKNELQHKLTTAFELILFLFLPVQLILIIFPEEIISIIFVSSKFSVQDTQIIANCLIILGCSTIFYSLFSVISKFFYGINKPVKLLAIVSIGFITKVALNFILLEPMGFITIAVSSAAAFAVMFLAGGYILLKELNYSLISYANGFGRIFLAFLLPGSLISFFAFMVPSLSAILLIVSLVIFYGMYLGMSYLLKISVFGLILNFFKIAR